MNKYWVPNKFVIEQIEDYCKINNFEKILEIGPGEKPFSLANHYVDNVERENSFILDIDTDKFDLPDQHFDFTYCRHVFEDIQNPDFAFKELKRVSKQGYIETPSPLVECIRGVDYTSNGRGYIHHRYIIWNEDNKIHFLPKFPIIELLEFDDDALLKLAEEPLNWNNYILWNQDTEFIIYKNGLNLDISNGYNDILNIAISSSLENTKKLFLK